MNNKGSERKDKILKSNLGSKILTYQMYIFISYYKYTANQKARNLLHIVQFAKGLFYKKIPSKAGGLWIFQLKTERIAKANSASMGNTG